MLGDQRRKGLDVGLATAADMIGGLEDVRIEACLPEPVSTGQAREAGADDGDPNR